MKDFFKLLLFAIALTMVPQSAMAQTFTCSGSGPHCQYTGKISRAYINEDNLMLIYFEQPFDIALPAAVGILGVSRGDAGSYLTTNNHSYSEFLYSTALTALAADKTVVVQFFVAQSGYLRVNKIWIDK